MTWEPHWTRSHIHEYLNQIPSSISNHSGLALAMDSVMNYGPNNVKNTSLSTATLDKRPKCAKTDSSRFATVLNLRAKYSGELTGLLAVYSELGNTTLTEKLIGNVWQACTDQSDAAHREALWRATAMLINSPKLDRKLLNCIASSQIRLFTSEAMTTSVECWQWLITAKPELQVRFLQEMSAAWNFTVQKRMGLFSEAPQQTSPLAKHEGIVYIQCDSSKL